jgi:nucleotide-binding universal stress UspA family protein
MSGQSEILVGVDGSEASIDALRWAIQQAQSTDSTLSVIMSWHSFGVGAVPAPPSDANLAAQASVFLQMLVERHVPVNVGIKVKQHTLEGHPADVLVSLSANADLLVVGSRGHGEFAGMLMSSVSERCAAHASCPVVIVRRG